MRKFDWSFLTSKRNLYLLGFLIAAAVTFMEVARGRHLNFLIFADSTLDFWRGISPYTPEWVAQHVRFFLYAPPFSVLFAPFAHLPGWLGPFAWNLFNYTLFYLAVFTLPERFSERQKCRIFLFTLPILAQSLLSFQYNVPVAYLFLFAWSLLERGRGFWAVVLIMISGFTKIYGIFELALLVCYPRFWRNLAYALVAGAALFALPLLRIAPEGLLPYYGEWLDALTRHQAAKTYDSLFYARPLADWMLAHFRLLQILSLGTLAALFLASFRKWTTAAFRAQALGILMGWVVLFSDSAEKHTYVIALTGFALWYWSRPRHTRTDKVLFWANFVLLGLVPIDIICPVPVMRFVTRTLWLHVWVFCFTWLRMAYLTFLRPVADFPQAAESDPDTPRAAQPGDTLDVVCPCYNPAPDFIERLNRSLEELRAMYPAQRLHLIVANDGSPRGFGEAEHAELLRTIADAEIVDIPHGGKGAAIRAGIARSQAPYTIYTDIDMPYAPESMRQVIDRVLAGCDVVIAVRNRSYHAKLSPMRKVMSYGSKMLNRLFLNIRYTDTQGGLKGLSPRAREVMLRTRIDDFLFDTEFVVLAARDRRMRIEQIETTLREGIVMSKMPGKVLVRELKNFFRIACRL
ncbi:glycosyltransferase 87 family protein [Alistipes sp.]|uniref:glycosyltransferase 87 family protein n=1 Tax=Alistipes sp. TaxID=1872444 RepID=UPI003AF1469A